MVWRLYGLASCLRRFTPWRMPARWWLLLFAGIPVVFYLGAAIAGTMDDPFAYQPQGTARSA